MLCLIEYVGICDLHLNYQVSGLIALKCIAIMVFELVFDLL